jgi:hypothetical protein
MRRFGMALGVFRATAHKAVEQGEGDMNSIAAGIAGALISGVAMYTLGAGDALGQSVDTQLVPPAYATALRPIAAPSAGVVTPVRHSTTRRTTTNAARRPVYRRTPVQDREVARDQREDEREIVRDDDDHSWGKTAMIIGGSAAGGAGVGGIVGGKKGALIGAAIGGGAASIYEATQRR